jgi:hypothetical protein
MREIILDPDTQQVTIRRMRISHQVPKPTQTLSVYVVITVFPLQQWLHENASMLRYTYTACLVRF